MKLLPEQVRSIYEAHTTYWEDQSAEMRELKNLYDMRYFAKNNTQLVVESSRAYEMVESYVASLFTRDPSVSLRMDLRAEGDPVAAQEVANRFLRSIRPEIERATRLGLIYPCSFLKLSNRDGVDPLDRISAQAVAPWDVIVDPAATSWSTQRYVAHRYWISASAAKARFGSRKKFSPKAYQSYLNTDSTDEGRNESDLMVEIVEFYWLEGEDKFVVWSPDYEDGSKFVFSGTRVQIGSSFSTDPDDPEGLSDSEVAEKSVVFDGIPYRTSTGRPVVPIVPINFTPDPDQPLRGYSALRRVSDYVKEIARLRSYQANSARKHVRQYMAVKGILDDDAIAALVSGEDGEVVEIDIKNSGFTLSEAFLPIPDTNMSQELQVYLSQIENDFSRGSILAPFSRGEATKATATEVTALAAYTSSEIGRHARERDSAIATVAQVYNLMLALILGDDAEPLMLGGEPTLLTETILTAEYTYYAADMGSTAISEAAKRQNIMTLAPTLAQLGVPQDKLLEHIVDLFDLPEDFIPEAQPMEAAPANTPDGPQTAPETAEEQIQRGVGPASIERMI